MFSKVHFLEALVVLLILGGIACMGGARITDWSGSIAVFLGFLHSQLSFDLADGTELVAQSRVKTRLRNIFMLKETVWIATFLMLGSWPLLAGAMMFLSYPSLRALTRKRGAQPERIS